MESGVENPPVLDPLLALVDRDAAGEEPGQRRELELLEVAELVGHHLPRDALVGDGHHGDGAEPGDARLAVLPDGAAEVRRDVGAYVVAPQRQRPRRRLLALPPVVAEVADGEAVRRPAEALRPQRPLEPPRPPPRVVFAVDG